MRRFLPAVLSALTLTLIGTLGLVAGVPWLFPSLGPTIAIQTGSPDAPTAQFWNVVIGHLVGLASGIAAVFLTGAEHVPSVMAAHSLSLERLEAAAMAVLLSMALQALLKAQHPPAEATTLLVALGALEPNSQSSLTVIAGVALVAILGSSAKRLIRALP